MCEINNKEIEAGVNESRSLSFEEKMVQGYEYKGGTTHIHPWLSSMVNYAEPVKFQTFEIAEGKLIDKNVLNEHARLWCFVHAGR